MLLSRGSGRSWQGTAGPVAELWAGGQHHSRGQAVWAPACSAGMGSSERLSTGCSILLRGC